MGATVSAAKEKSIHMQSEICPCVDLSLSFEMTAKDVTTNPTKKHRYSLSKSEIKHPNRISQRYIPVLFPRVVNHFILQHFKREDEILAGFGGFDYFVNKATLGSTVRVGKGF